MRSTVNAARLSDGWQWTIGARRLRRAIILFDALVLDDTQAAIEGATTDATQAVVMGGKSNRKTKAKS